MRNTTWLTLFVLLLANVPAAGQLQIQNIEAAHGPVGPARTTLDCFPGDEIVFRFVITGVKTDEEGKAKLVMVMTHFDPHGKKLAGKEAPQAPRLEFGGGTAASHVYALIAVDHPPGKYQVHLKIKDGLSLEEAEFTREYTVVKTDFALVRPRFYHDSALTSPAPAGGTLGQQLFLRVKAVGYDPTQGKIDTSMSIQVFDAKGKEPLGKPIVSKYQTTDPEPVKTAELVLGANLGLNRLGDFVLRLSATDHTRNKTAVFETALRVTAP